MFRTLRSRLLLTYLLVAGLVVLLVSAGIVLALAQGQFGVRLVYTRLQELGARITAQEGNRLARLEGENLQLLVENLADRHKVRILVLGGNAEILADSQKGRDPTAQFPLDLPEGQMEGEYQAGRGQAWRYIYIHISPERTIVLAARKPVVRVILFLGGELLKPVIRITAVALLISVFLAAAVSSSVVRPLSRMNSAMQTIASGKYDERLPLEGSQEMRMAAKAFNEMAARVQAGQVMERDFVANVSHELKTPLTSIQGFAQAILDGTAANSEAITHAASVISIEAGRLHRLVLDLLDLARLDSGQIEFERTPLDPVILLENVVEKFGMKAAEKSISLNIEMDPLPEIVGDGDRLAQVFTNLLDNAIKHSPGNAVVWIRANVEAESILVRVIDQGEGIEAKDLPKIFDRFFQVDRSRSREGWQGSGLGLSISREIIEGHGGQLYAESSTGQGSCFFVQLPIIHPSDETIHTKRSGSFQNPAM